MESTGTHFSRTFILSSLLLISYSTIITAVLPNITTQFTSYADRSCNTCPHTLCQQVEKLDTYRGNYTFSCWTRGEKLANDSDSIWLYTSDHKCYVPQYNLDYNGTAEEEMEYCGHDSQEISYTKKYVKIKYLSECFKVPALSTSQIKTYYKQETSLMITCWTDAGDVILDDNVWFKTQDNCFVPEVNLYYRLDKKNPELDNCTSGPKPVKDRAEASGEVNSPKSMGKRSTESIFKRYIQKAAKLFSKRYLRKVTIGEDDVKCHELPIGNGTVERYYDFNSTVLVQCYSDSLSTTYEPSFLLTEDFCYISSMDIWEGLGNFYGFPSCKRFGLPAGQ